MQLGGNNEWSTQPFNPILYLFSHQTSDWIKSQFPDKILRISKTFSWAEVRAGASRIASCAALLPPGHAESRVNGQDDKCPVNSPKVQACQ